MPFPSTTLETLRPDLAGALMEFNLAADREGFIGTRVMPVFEVAEQAGVFGKIPIEQLLRTASTTRAPGAGYPRGNFEFTTASYATVENGWEEPIDRRQSRMYRNYIDAEMVATQRAYDKVLRNLEIRIADLLFNGTTWTGAALTTSVGTEWSTVADAKPQSDIMAAKQKVWDGTGLWPNAVIMNRKVFNNARRCAEIQDIIAAQGAGTGLKPSDINADMLARVFDVDMVLVAGSGENTAKKGQDASVSAIWSDEYVMVAKVATSNDIAEPCVGRVFHWGEDGSSIGGAVETYYEAQTRSDVVRVRCDTDELVLYKECAHLLSNITA